MKREKEQINSKSSFKDRLEIKEQREMEKPKDGKGTFWDFRAPCYDQRSSNFVNAGTHYGSGRTQPIGTEKQSDKYAVPLGRHHTMRDDDRG
jgi:hypothetical protein